MNIVARIMVRDIEAYKRLIEQTDLEIKDKDGASLLRIAVAYGAEDIALDLVSRGVEIDQLTKSGMTELQTAFWRGFWHLGRKLIERGASLEHFDSNGNNALWYAVTHPRPDYELIEQLVNAGSDVQTKNRAGRSPLDAAQQIGDSRMIKILEAKA